MRITNSIARTTLGLLVAGVLAAAAQGAEPAPLAVYEKDGQVSYALSLAAKLPARELDAVDVVVLFDTSASQQGAYREAALAGLDALLAGMRASDRVQLLAVDLDAKALTSEFVAPNSPEVAKATASLRQQAPLGSTDLEAALRAATQRLAEANTKNRAVIYVGDGISMANMLDSPTLGGVIEQLRAARTPVSSYAIGPQVNAQVLAVLANHTGGNLYVSEPLTWQDDAAGVTDARAREENIRLATAVGKNLALWSRAVVMWPEKAQIPDQLGQTYPATFPPLRADRDTVVIGRAAAPLPQGLSVQLAGAVNGKPVELTWDVAAEPSNPDRGYLAELVDAASGDGGLTLPTVGTAGLAEVARMFGARADQLTMLAERAVASGDRVAAGRIAQAVLRADPGNVQARTVQNVAAGQAAPAVPPQAETIKAPAAAPPQGDGIRLVQPSVQAPAAPAPSAQGAATGGGLLGSVGADGAFLDAVEQERRAFAGMLEKEISNTVIQARDRMATEPLAVIQELKLALERVRRVMDLDAAKRAELEDKLEIALKEAMNRAEIKDELDRLAQEEIAAAREQKLLAERLVRRIEREKQLMLRFDSLMDERRYIEASEVAQIIEEEVDPEGVTPRMATLQARHVRNHYLQMLARSMRHQAFWESMYQVELSHIPFPDNPPIVYPEASVWEELSKRRKDRYREVDLKGQSEAESRIYGALRQKLVSPWSFVQTPLSQVKDQIQEEYDIPIQFDTAALEAAASSPDVEVTIDINNVSLRSALDLMLKQLEDLTYIVDDEVLLITTQDEADQRLQVKVYPVADLVLPIQNIGGAGGMMGGGMMGGGGMGGGGMGGGGMGGGGMGGGGMGGGGMGGGGGGFFAVPDKLTEDDAKTPAISPTTLVNVDALPSVPASAPVAVPAAKTPHVRGIEIDAAQEPHAFWSKHFAGKQEDAAVVRRAVRDLMRQNNYDHAIALIQAALENGQPQPWMYESLGIAMELGGRPKAEIERAIMSACDFSNTPDELMLIARYLSSLGLEGRAVDVYRQVIKAAPLYQEAYALGLQAAERAKDLDGIRWATVGILEQAWPNNQQAIRNTALHKAEAALAQLRESGDAAAADEYQRDLNAALIRDCVVTVSWSGDADVDLLVEEPTGTTCSLQNPRTVGGGVCLGDDFASADKSSGEGFHETYVCPRGFAGEYKVRIRKVWGDLVADRVTVDVYKYFRSQNELHERQHVTIGKDDAMVLFNLETGRRTDRLEDQQLAAAVDRQREVSSKVMAQQFGDDMGSMAHPSIIPSRNNLDPLDLRRQLALARGGGVGFQPVIITLPDGTSMIATAVVSADRRYVRITSSPNFTGIGNVTTFTFAGSAEETGGGGGDGGGGDGGGGDGGGGDGGGGAP